MAICAECKKEFDPLNDLKVYGRMAYRVVHGGDIFGEDICMQCLIRDENAKTNTTDLDAGLGEGNKSDKPDLSEG